MCNDHNEKQYNKILNYLHVMYSRFFLAVSCVNKVSDREQVIDTSTVPGSGRPASEAKDQRSLDRSDFARAFCEAR